MKLSIVLITYNHEKYIRKCIESIVSQEFDFEWELVIAYDYSVDRTLSIVEEYRDKIKNFSISVQKSNVGISTNCADAIASTRGELLAFIDGDDYNIDTKKYIKQVAVFDNNPDVSFCFASGYCYIEKDEKTQPYYEGKLEIPEKFDLEYFYCHNLRVNPTTMMCRSISLPDEFPHFFYKHYNVDWMLASFCALRGNFFFLNEPLACYRIHPKSISRSTKRINALLLASELNNQMNEYLNYKYDWFLGKKNWYNEQLTYEYMKDREYKKMLYSAIRYLLGGGLGLSDLRYFIATLINIFFNRKEYRKQEL